jgi:NADPH-dependent curcumin reductase CurA
VCCVKIGKWLLPSARFQVVSTASVLLYFLWLLQLAKALGASKIVATASAPKHDLLRSLGCDEVIDYKTQDITQVRE